MGEKKKQRSPLTTLCYIEKDDSYLMLHRIKKKQDVNEGKWLGKLNYNISQTPQVWLDHQVVEMDGCLCLFWDAVEELFYPGMLDDMFHQRRE